MLFSNLLTFTSVLLFSQYISHAQGEGGYTDTGANVTLVIERHQAFLQGSCANDTQALVPASIRLGRCAGNSNC